MTGAIMDFLIPAALDDEIGSLKKFLKKNVKPELAAWYQNQEIPAQFFRKMGAGNWYAIGLKEDRLVKGSALKEALIIEELAKVSPGVAVAVLAQIDLGLMGLLLFGSDELKERYGHSAVKGETLMSLGNTERQPAAMWPASRCVPKKLKAAGCSMAPKLM
jgi:alkylation response protein AidB-like acyl-CoA dehydrogenase